MESHQLSQQQQQQQQQGGGDGGGWLVGHQTMDYESRDEITMDYENSREESENIRESSSDVAAVDNNNNNDRDRFWVSPTYLKESPSKNHSLRGAMTTATTTAPPSTMTSLFDGIDRTVAPRLSGFDDQGRSDGGAGVASTELNVQPSFSAAAAVKKGPSPFVRWPQRSETFPITPTPPIKSMMMGSPESGGGGGGGNNGFDDGGSSTSSLFHGIQRTALSARTTARTLRSSTPKRSSRASTPYKVAATQESQSGGTAEHASPSNSIQLTELSSPSPGTTTSSRQGGTTPLFGPYEGGATTRSQSINAPESQPLRRSSRKSATPKSVRFAASPGRR
uniref:Uncharacterized protein n=1 Tax=Octactis speculum TaxID=3111310 RepID=A0A7S2F6R4_9STRA